MKTLMCCFLLEKREERIERKNKSIFITLAKNLRYMLPPRRARTKCKVTPPSMLYSRASLSSTRDFPP